MYNVILHIEQVQVLLLVQMIRDGSVPVYVSLVVLVSLLSPLGGLIRIASHTGYPLLSRRPARTPNPVFPSRGRPRWMLWTTGSIHGPPWLIQDTLAGKRKICRLGVVSMWAGQGVWFISFACWIASVIVNLNWFYTRSLSFSSSAVGLPQLPQSLTLPVNKVSLHVW